MGKSIVYCHGCGKRLFEEDFDSKKAHIVEDRPFCIECKPRPESAPTSPPAHATPRAGHPTADKALPAWRPERKPDTTRRRKPPGGGNAALFLGLSGGALAIILIVALLSSGGRKTAPSPAPPPAPSTPSTRPDRAPTPPPVKAQPKDVSKESARDIERKMAEAAGKARSDRIGKFISDIRKMIDSDRGFERSGEIEQMIASALEDAGARRAEIEALRAEYRRRKEAAGETIGHWTFDGLAGKKVAGDSSSSRRDATLTSGCAPVPGRIGGAVHFDGVGGAGTVENIDGLSPHAGLKGELTLSVWVKVDPPKKGKKSGSAPVVAKGTSDNWEYALYASPGGAAFYLWQLGGADHAYLGVGGAPAGTWHHLAGVYRKGKFARVYVNGALKMERTTFKGSMSAGPSPLYFGRRGDGNHFKGAIDDVRIYARALSDVEIKKLAEGGR